MKRSILFSLTILSVIFAKTSQAITPPGNFDYSIVVTLNDTTNVKSLHIDLGSGDSAHDLLQQNINYDQTSGLPAGVIYIRKENKIFLTLGSYPIGVPLYCNVQIEQKNGQLLPVQKYMYK